MFHPAHPFGACQVILPGGDVCACAPESSQQRS